MDPNLCISFFCFCLFMLCCQSDFAANSALEIKTTPIVEADKGSATGDTSSAGTLEHKELSSMPGRSSKTDFKGVPTLSRIWPTNQVGISAYCHVLLFYGLGPADLPRIPSGKFALKALTDEETAIRVFGKSPFAVTRSGLRYFLFDDPVFKSQVGETHRDQCLSTFASLDLPLATPIQLKTKTYSIADLLSDSIATFSFDEKEPAWTAMAYAKYLPPQKEWTNRFGEKASFSAIVEHLLKLDYNSQSCGGTHIFQALVKIYNADQRYAVLDGRTRNQLESYLKGVLDEAVRFQQKDGSWGSRWCSSISNDQELNLQYRILVTGHLLEIFDSLDSKHRLPEEVYMRSAKWLEQALNSSELKADNSLICPFTHAARTARKILNDAHSPKVAKVFHPTE